MDQSTQPHDETMPLQEIEDVAPTHPTDEEENVFLASLETITPEEIAPDAEVTPLSFSDRVYEAVRILLMVVCAGVFLFCAWTLIDEGRQNSASDAYYSDLADRIFADDAALPALGISRMMKPQGENVLPIYADALLADSEYDAGSVAVNKSYNLEFERMKAVLADLREINPDVFGYIRIDGTSISYPLVKGEDNDHYLNYQINGQPSVSGSIYADYRCKTTNLLEDHNLILYGHNMTNGTMFNHVTRFYDASVFYNTQIVVYTFDGIYTYEPFNIFSTHSAFPYFTTYFPEKQDMIDFCQEMQSYSKHNRGLTFTGDEKLLTLSTCTNVGDGRYVLHARLIKVEN